MPLVVAVPRAGMITLRSCRTQQAAAITSRRKRRTITAASASQGAGTPGPRPVLHAVKEGAQKAAAAAAALCLCAAQVLTADVRPAVGAAELTSTMSAEPRVRAVQELLLDVWREVDERFVDAATAPVDWRQAQQAREHCFPGAIVDAVPACSGDRLARCNSSLYLNVGLFSYSSAG